MATNRTRRARNQTIPPAVEGLFICGTGCNHLPPGRYAELWERYGSAFCRKYPDHKNLWAIAVEGMEPR